MSRTYPGRPLIDSVVHRLGGGILAAARLCVIVPPLFIIVYVLLAIATPSQLVDLWVWLERAVVSAGILGLLWIFARHPWRAGRPAGLTHALANSYVLVLPAVLTGFWPAVFGAFVTPLLVAGFAIAERFRRPSRADLLGPCHISLETAAAPSTWLPMPLTWGSAQERRDWARTQAELLWAPQPERPEPSDIQSLTHRLDTLAETIPAKIPAHQVFLYAPDPRRIPLAFYAAHSPAEGDRMEQLAAAVQFGGDGAAPPAEMGVFSTEHLGPGLRSLRRWTSRQGSPCASLNFAWRLEALGVDLSVRTVSDDPEWLVAHLGACDDFVRGLRARPASEASRNG